MTISEMKKALETGFNKQGRHLSMSMTANYLAAIAEAERPKKSSELYRGFKVEGISGTWFVESFPVVYTSRKAALEQVDRCLETRALMAEEN